MGAEKGLVLLRQLALMFFRALPSGEPALRRGQKRTRELSQQETLLQPGRKGVVG
jgi:hypothetical protein